MLELVLLDVNGDIMVIFAIILTWHVLEILKEMKLVDSS